MFFSHYVSRPPRPCAFVQANADLSSRVIWQYSLITECFQGPAVYSPWARSSPLPVLVHSGMDPWPLSRAASVLQQHSWLLIRKTHKTYSISSLVLYRKKFSDLWLLPCPSVCYWFICLKIIIKKLRNNFKVFMENFQTSRNVCGHFPPKLLVESRVLIK